MGVIFSSFYHVHCDLVNLIEKAIQNNTHKFNKLELS